MVLEALSGLLDEKLIRIIRVFVENPDKRFHLSEVSRLAGVNNASTFRILNKLLHEGFISAIVIGKVRAYHFSKSERAMAISQLIIKEREKRIDGLDLFVKKLEMIPRIKRVILDSRAEKSAQLIVISDYFFRERIERMCKEVFAEDGFKVTFVELTPQQFEDMKRIGNFAADKKILLKRD